MNKQSVLTLDFLLIVIFALVFSQVTSADAQNVHALLIILGNDRDIRASVEKNESNMQNLLRQVSKNCEVYMTVMKSETEIVGKITSTTLSNARPTNITEQKQEIISAKQVVQWIRDLSPNSEDTILIYYSGHGSMDAIGTHILNFDPEVTNDFVGRDGLRNQLQRKPGRLKMLITDTCSNRVRTLPLIARVYAKVQSKERRYTKNLFLEHNGFLDITAASEGQYAWGNDEIGGYLTVSLIGSFTAEADANQDSFLSWKEVSAITRSKTQKLFSQTTFLPHNQRKLDEAGQITQTPIAHELPNRLIQSPASRSETTATLTVTSVPSGASVYIDGIWAGKTPLIDHTFHLRRQDEKPVQLELKLKDYKSKIGEWTPKKGQKRQKVAWRDVHLEKLAAPHIPQTITGKDGAEMVLIPAGKFRMGSNYSDAYFDERAITVYVDALYMDKYEVTNAQYRKFVLANPQWQKGRIEAKFHNGTYLKYWIGNNYPSGKGNHPVMYISWYAAMAYAEWAEKRLPTEAEWEKAARGGLISRKYPNGNTMNSKEANYYSQRGSITVGSYPMNAYGLHDMAGNVEEWCLDKYAVSPRNRLSRTSGVDRVMRNFMNVKSSRVLRGGSWNSPARNVRVSYRSHRTPRHTDGTVGFRCVRAVTP